MCRRLVETFLNELDAFFVRNGKGSLCEKICALAAIRNRLFPNGGMRRCHSVPFRLRSGVPQGCALGPYLFNAYMTNLANLLSSLNLKFKFHIYADDIILYVDISTEDAVQVFSDLQRGLDMIEEWMTSHHLLLSPSKTFSLLLGRASSSTQSVPPLCIRGTQIDMRRNGTLTWLGVPIDPMLTMREFVNQTCRSAYPHLRMLLRARCSLDKHST